VEEFFGRYRNLSVLLAVVLAQIILLGYQVRTDQGSSLLREWTVRGVTPVTKGVRGVTNWIGSSWDNYFWLVGAKQENDELLRQVEGLKLENAGLRSSLARFGREERLIAYQQELISQTVLAQVIGRGANSNSREIFISAGLDKGVTAGMPVITPDGIVGKVQASYPGAALVMLINDPEAGVGVVMSRSRAGGILKGTGHSYCGIDYISHEVDVAMGETVYTSGDDRVFPKGLPIGEVVKLDRGTDFQEIRIKPFAALDRLEEVLVITAGIHQDLPESPQAQPPQFLMPLPEKVDPLPGAETPEQASDSPAPPADPRQLDQSGRVTDADRLRQYYQAIAAQQGHRIGYGLPGSKPPNFTTALLL
jgi:rod shape-determining protein MreC